MHKFNYHVSVILIIRHVKSCHASVMLIIRHESLVV